jgi:hypothetical protein
MKLELCADSVSATVMLFSSNYILRRKMSVIYDICIKNKLNYFTFLKGTTVKSRYNISIGRHILYTLNSKYCILKLLAQNGKGEEKQVVRLYV